MSHFDAINPKLIGPQGVEEYRFNASSANNCQEHEHISSRCGNAVKYGICSGFNGSRDHTESGQGNQHAVCHGGHSLNDKMIGEIVLGGKLIFESGGRS